MNAETDKEPTLHEALARAGWRSEPRPDGYRLPEMSMAGFGGRLVYDAAGALRGCLTASETWALLRKEGHYP